MAHRATPSFQGGRSTLMVAHVVHASAPPLLDSEELAMIAEEFAREEALEEAAQQRRGAHPQPLAPIADDESTATADDDYLPEPRAFEETKESTPLSRSRPADASVAAGVGPTRSRPPVQHEAVTPNAFEALYCRQEPVSQDVLVHAALTDAHYEEDRAAWLRLRRAEREKHNAVPKRKVFVAYLLFLGCLGALIWEIGENGWAFEDLSVNPFFGPSVDTLMSLGAINYFKIVDDGEWWRFFTGMWLHGGIIHFVINGVVIVQLGRNLEELHGPVRLVVVYLISGVAAAAVSALLSPFTISVGASGALFGLLGGIWADLIQNWNIVYKPFRQLAGLSVLTVMNILVGLMPLVDNYQHLGGLTMGMCLGFLLFVQPRFDAAGVLRPKRPYQGVLQITGAVLAFNLLLLVFTLLCFQVDVEGRCGGVCEDLSCVETPLWDCGSYQHSCTGTAYTNGTVFVDCYLNDRSAQFNVDYPISDLNNARLEDLCQEACS